MKKISLILIIWVFFVNFTFGQQIEAAEYFFDSDPGLGLAEALPISPGTTITETFTIPTTGLSEGLHVLHIRTQDTNGTWSLYQRRYFFVNSLSQYQNPPEYNIVEARYFFDDDPGVGNGTNLPITEGSSINETFSIDTSGLVQGLHVLQIRAKDANGTWSLYDRKYFFINSQYQYENPPEYNIVEARYFFDDDPGVGNGTDLPITVGNSINELFNIDTSGLDDGLHVLHIRAKDASGTWSVYDRKYFFINSPSQYENPPQYNIVEARYFFDNDPGVGNDNILPVTPGSSVNELFDIDTTSLEDGLHVLHLRVKDANGTWSLYERKYFYVIPPYENPEPVQIVGAEYFVDIDPGVGNGLPLTVTDDFTINETFEIPVECFPVGNHELHIRVVDANGTWSQYLLETFTVETNEAPPVTVCQNITVQLDETGQISITPADVDNGSFDPCTTIASYSLSQTDFDCSHLGDNTVTLTVTNSNGFPSTCDAIVTVEDITPPTVITKNIIVQLDTNGNATITNNAVDDGSSDACGGLTFSTSKTSFICSDLGDNTVTLTVGDSSGNEAFQNAIVTVIDATPPTVKTQNITVELTENGTVSIAEDAVNDGSNDACGGLIFNTDITEFNCLNVGQNLVTLYVTDANSNTASSTAIVTVEGNVAPTVIAAENITSIAINNCSVEITIPDALLEGNCDNNLTWEMSGVNVDTGTGQIGTYVFPVGTTTILYTNTDNTSQSATDTMTVTVTDDEDPSIICPTDITKAAESGSCTALVSVEIPIANDNCGVLSVLNNFNNTNDASDTYPVGETQVIWTVTDNNGRASECIQTITITDSELPTINGITGLTVSLDASCDFIIPDYTNLAVVSDNCGINNIIQDPAVGTVISGHNTVQEITLTVYDNGGNTNNTSFNITLEGNETFYADSDGDGYGNPDITILDCKIPLGYTDNNLDCDDTDGTINPSSQSLSFSGNSNFTDKLISTTNGSPYSTFYFEIKYTDLNNQLPPGSFPRVYLDYEGNGVYNNPNDRIILMSPSDANDLITNDGKTYYASINNLPTGTNWETSIQIIDGDCISKIGPYNYPDVQIQPDLEIFANDITFSDNNPAVSSPVTVSAVIHNVSDFSLYNIDVSLLNQYDNTAYPDILVPYMSPNSSTTVSWDIITPNVDSWNPMQVIVDSNNTIEETNENNNSATRPIIVGDVDLPGDIIVNGITNPSVSYAGSNNYISISGYGYYDNTVVPLVDPSVAGGTVNFTIVETGATYATNTNQNGNWSYIFPAPQTPGVYHITGTLTDFTLTGNFESQFEILMPVPSCLPDLKANVTASQYQIFVGESITIDAFVQNIGCAAVSIDTWADAQQTGGNPFLEDELVGPLNPGESFNLSSTSLNFDTPGTYSICYTADGTFLVEESNENNNIDCVTIRVLPLLVDLIPSGGPNSSQFLCNNPTPSFTVRNIGTIASGPFSCNVIVNYERNYVTTITENVPNIDASSSYSFSINYNYLQVGEYSFVLECDIPIATEGVVAESNELNNVGTYTILIKECKPDLLIDKCNGVTVTPVNPDHPSTHTYNITIKNSGNAIAQAPIEVELIRSDTNTPIIINYPNDLNPGETATLNYDINSVPPATETLQVNIDPNNLIDEFNESNNDFFDNLCWDFETVPVCGTNFWNRTYHVNQNINLYVGINNNDLYEATDVKVKFEVSGPGITGNLDLGNAVIPYVNKTCYCPIVAVLPYGFVFNQTGTYTFTMSVDPDNEFTECSEENNVLIRDVEVVDNLPDLTIKSENINPSLINPDINEPINIDITYENLGLSNVDDIMQLDILIDEVLIESWPNVSGLVNGGTNTLSISSPWSSSASGAHVIRAIIDVNNNVEETNELNNEATRAIIVGPAANLKIKEFISSNYSPNIGEGILFDITIENEGELECGADLELTFIDDFQNEIFITSIPINVLGNSSIQITDVPWDVLDSSTTVIANIINSTVTELSYDDNSADLKLGRLDITVVATPSCNNNPNGTLLATVENGTPPYSYEWSDDSLGNLLTGTAGIYTLIVTDNTGFTTSIEAEIENDTTDTDNDTVPDCLDVCPGFDDLADADNDGTPDGCDTCDDTLIGTSCDDDDPCTINDVYTADCGCEGTLPDSDNDTVPDCLDVCPGFDDLADADNDGTPDGCDTCDDTLIGTSCDDDDPCTINDVYTADCGCEGTLPDSDNDTVPDCLDVCPGFDDLADADNDGTPDGCDTCDDTLIGTSCDDDDPCTINDVYTADCGCEGTLPDSDNDTVPDCLDVCPGFDDLADADNDGTPDGCDTCDDTLIGTSCDDDDPCTINDVYTADCGCEGTLPDSDNDTVPDCLDVCPGFDDLADADNDGTPDGCDTCDDTLIGTSCDDDDPCTINDVYTADCGCEGTLPDSDNDTVPDCLDVCPGFDDLADADNDGTPDGCDTCDDTLIGTSCDDDDPCTINDVYTADCGCEGTLPDSDNDTVPDCLDVCPGFDDLADADNDGTPDGCDTCDDTLIGTSCDDDDPCTINDVYTADCGCEGTLPDSDNDTVPDCLDVCPGFDDLADADNDGTPDGCDTCDDTLIGTSCDDDDPCTINDVYTADCGCEGTLPDSDNDTVPDCLDVCPGFDDLADADNDGTPDGCDTCDDTLIGTSCDDDDPCTINDVYTADCGCEGTLPDSDNDTVPDCLDVCPGFDDLADADNDGTPDGCDTCDDTLIGTSCDDDDPCTINDVYTADCGCEGTLPDSDNDTVPDCLDVCPGFDDLADADNDGTPDGCDTCDDTLIGTSCDDDDPCTINDVYTADCGCEGTLPDSDNDTVPDCLDVCPGFDDLADADNDGTPDGCDTCDDTLIGTSCDDDDPCTINDVYTADCGCEGTLPDSDNDTVPDCLDVCPGFDDLADADNDGTPDGCEVEIICESAYAKNNSNSTCFIEDSFDNWGWTNYFNTTGNYSMELYSGAGQCILSNGMLVGHVDINFDNEILYATYNLLPGYTMSEAHLYVGCEPYPNKGRSTTVSPGQYPFKKSGLEDVTSYSIGPIDVSELGGQLYIIAHANVCKSNCYDCVNIDYYSPNKNKINCKTRSKISSRASLNIYPNPVTKDVTFEISSGKPSEATLTIYNSYGMVVYTQYIGSRLTIDLDISNYITKAGVYFAVITSSDFIINKKFIFSN